MLARAEKVEKLAGDTLQIPPSDLVCGDCRTAFLVHTAKSLIPVAHPL